MDRHYVNRLPWPPRFPDYFPTEHVWGMMKGRLSSLQHPPQTLAAISHVVEVAVMRYAKISITSSDVYISVLMYKILCAGNTFLNLFFSYSKTLKVQLITRLETPNICINNYWKTICILKCWMRIKHPWASANLFIFHSGHHKLWNCLK